MNSNANTAPPVMQEEVINSMNPIQEVPVSRPAANPPMPVVDPSAFLPSSRVINVSAVE